MNKVFISHEEYTELLVTEKRDKFRWAFELWESIGHPEFESKCVNFAKKNEAIYGKKCWTRVISDVITRILAKYVSLASTLTPSELECLHKSMCGWFTKLALLALKAI